MCNKISYETKADALFEIKIIYADRRRFKSTPTRGAKHNRKLSCYLCDCGKWHLTSLPKAIQKRIYGS
jgi:hypothetical protein